MLGELLPHSPYLWVVNSLKLPLTHSPNSGVLCMPLCVCVCVCAFILLPYFTGNGRSAPWGLRRMLTWERVK